MNSDLKTKKKFDSDLVFYANNFDLEKKKCASGMSYFVKGGGGGKIKIENKSWST